MRPRDAVARCVTGLYSTMVRSQPGIVAGSTKMLLANVRGKRSRKLVVMTDSGVLTNMLTMIQIHETLNANSSTRPTAARTPSGPPPGRNPRRRPTMRMTSAAIE
jgi:hypothetical protein